MPRLPLVKCKVSQPYEVRTPCGEFTWYVYSKNSGNIVASTYSEQMAETILTGIKNSWYYQDDYAITEKYYEPEPMV